MFWTCTFLFHRFATRERNALLLYNGRFNEKHDFIAVEIVNEQIQLTFSAGEFMYVCKMCMCAWFCIAMVQTNPGTVQSEAMYFLAVACE